MSDVKQLVCTQLMSDLDKAIADVESFARTYNKAVGAVEDTWNSIVDEGISTTDEIQDAIDEVFDTLEEAVPDLTSTEAFQELQEIIDACTSLDDPLSALRNLQDAMEDGWADFLQGIADAAREILAWIDMENLRTDLSKYKIQDRFNALDDFINCVETICSADALGNPIPEVIDKIDESIEKVNNLQESMRLNEIYEMDDARILENAGVAETHINKLIEMGTAVTVSKAAYATAHTDSVAAARGVAVTKEKELSNYLGFPTFDSTASLLYLELDPNFENQTLWLEEWNAWSMMNEKVFGTSTTDVVFRVLDCIIAEQPDQDIQCYSEYTMTMEIQIGSITHSSTKNYVYGTPICGDCDAYAAGGLPACNDEETAYARLYSGRASASAISEILNTFTLNEVKSQIV
ncbi:MAG: hypothetical protein KAS32_08540 [Candidatus Peribacteraceae bacterium]|nr:hypothetical protein [Candidatus Peribacteraceae bacterium]